MAMAGISPNNLLQGLGKQPGFSSVVTKNSPPLVDRHHTSGSGYYHSHKKGKKKSIALSALTLLSFMVFLNLLQHCLEQQMEHYNTSNSGNPQVIIVQQREQEGREEAQKRKGEDQLEGAQRGEPGGGGGERRSKGRGTARTTTTSTTPKYTQIPVKLNTMGKYKYN